MKTIVFGILFSLFFSFALFGQSTKIDSLVTDTVKIGNRTILLKVPYISSILKKIYNYEEGSYFDYPFIDTSLLYIHVGSMVEIPFYTKFQFCDLQEEVKKDNVMSFRGRCGINYFREDYYKQYGATIVYKNISPNYVSLFDSIMNNVYFNIYISPNNAGGKREQDINFTPKRSHYGKMYHGDGQYMILCFFVLRRKDYFCSMKSTISETDLYYYHPDHLGSSSWITDAGGQAIQHLQYLPFGETKVDQRTTSWNTRYSFSAKEKDEESGYSYFGARYYDSELGIFLTSDPLSFMSPHLQSYHYCSQNPLNRVDPSGMVDDWVERTVEGKQEVYYDRDVKSQEDVDKKYGKEAGVKHLADGSKVGNGQYTVYNDHVNNKNGVVKDANGNTVNNHQNVIHGDGFTLFAGVTDRSVNAETLHKNWLSNSSYIGPNNPKDYKGKDNYDYQPIWSPTEMAAYRHDQNYDKAGAGVLSPKTKCPDLILIKECIEISRNPNNSSYERNRARAMSATFRAINFIFKTPRF